MFEQFRKFWSVILVAALLLPQLASGALAKYTVLENNVAYLRVSQTETNLPQEIASALDELSATNPMAGIVLDLRFAGGANFDDLKATEGALTEKKLPLAILVNAQTQGAAAGLADELRVANAGLIFGGGMTNPQPDISVVVTARDETNFLKTPYGIMATNMNTDSSTNFLPYADVDHTSEADLVREKIKDGEQDDTTQTNTPAAPRPYIRDPVLAHGVDFIKGVAALRLNHG